jgi:hypothetical protein
VDSGSPERHRAVVAADDKVAVRWRAEGTFENEFMGQELTDLRAGTPSRGVCPSLVSSDR